MKKLAALLLALALLLSCVPAQADPREKLNYPVNPYFHAAKPPSRSLASQNRGDLTIAVDWLTELGYDTPTQWHIQVTGATGDCTYTYFILDAEWDSMGYSTGTSPEYSYTFIIPGDYTLYVQVQDSAGHATTHLEEFTLEPDATHMTVEAKVAQLAAECLAAGNTTDFEKALWMHDWLTHNAYYDQTYSHYSADGVLLRGTGVCDSYRKAYALLLEAVGVEVTAATGGNHAWNQVKMDGEWYNVDVTWDDPIGGEKQYEAVSGNEGHMYFGVPTELMSCHTFETNPKSCTAYEMNYYIHTGKISFWSQDYVDGILRAIAEKNCLFTMEAPIWYKLENKEGWRTTGKQHILYPLIAYALNHDQFQAGDIPLRVQAAYLADSDLMQIQFCLEDYSLTLPASLTVIDTEAFQGDTAFLYVIVPEGASLGNRCFADCTNLWRVDIPASVTSISSTAFDNCAGATIFCPAGSAAEDYAAAHGLNCIPY